MAEITPFKGILYNKDKIKGDYSSVVAPPYDVISDVMREELYSKSPYNIIRLILGKDQDGDNGDNRYKRAGKFFNEWQRQGILEKDQRKSFYVYSQEYSHKGVIRKRTGFFGMVKIDEDGKEVLPHERTHSKAKEDRLNLISEVRANLSPIFTLFYDDSGKANAILKDVMAASAPEVDIKIDGVRHLLWRVSEGERTKGLSAVLSDKRLFIADGHHRYEVARKYRDIRRSEDGYNGEADRVMMYFADMADPSNLTVMATHRAIKKMPGCSMADIKAKLAPYFSFTEHGSLGELMSQMEKNETAGNVYGVLDKEGYLCMEPKDRKALTGLILENRTEDWKDLDVSIIHSAIFDELLGINSEEGNITYVKDAEEAESLVRNGSHAAAFILNPTRVEQMKAVAEHGEVMPQKSTYFYPKLLTGLVVNKLGE